MATITPDVPRQAPELSWRDQISKLDPILSWLFYAGTIIGVLSLAYIFLGLFNGAGSPAAYANEATRPQAEQFARDIKNILGVMHWAFIIAAIAMVVLALDLAWVGPVLAVVGIVLHFGAPLLLLKMLGPTPATIASVVTLRGTGMFLLVIGLLKYGVDFVRWLQDLPNRVQSMATIGSAHRAEAKQQSIARHANAFSPCWQLPFCREVIRLQCPAYLARSRCWKFGRGCYCDEEMIGRIIRGESLDKIKAPTAMSTKKPPCGRCHIFLEHQSLKYKMCAPIAVPATALICWLGWDLYSRVFMGVTSRLDALWGGLSIGKPNIMDVSDNAARIANEAAQEAAARTSQYGLWIFGILLGFFVLIYISKGIEWAILKMKW